MPRLIRYFDKKSELFINEITLPEIPLQQLQQLFDASSENPMYDSFSIGKAEEGFFKSHVDVEFTFDRFDYYLEYDS